MDNSRFKILVVDDNEELLFIAERTLTKAGYKVTTAATGSECMQSVSKDTPNIILLDVMLPDTNGFELCKTIKSNPETSNIFIILMSGLKTKTNDIAEGLELGSDGYISRPVPERELLARIKAACRTVKAEADLRAMNLELEKANAEKNKFISIIAHDLRNPFNSFLGLTEIMMKNLDKFNISELQTFSSRLYINANNLFDLLTNLLEWSRMQKGNIDFNPEFYKLDEILKNNTELFYETAKQKNINILLDVDNNIFIYADKFMLDTIIRNLISNSIKFSNRGNNVLVNGKITDNHIEICVKDNGIGMDENILNDLFKIDKRTSRKGTEKEMSTGLGLILCKEFIDKLNGKIEITSKENAGSEVKVSLPVK